MSFEHHLESVHGARQVPEAFCQRFTSVARVLQQSITKYVNMRKAFLLLGVLLLLSVIEAKKGKTKSKGKACNRPCNRKLKPVCASDGKTYNNVCLFNNAKCAANKTGVTLKISAQGPCQNETAKNRKEKAKCSAGLADCGKADNPFRHAVCGSDNKTYPSFCFFRVARCQAKQDSVNLTVQYKGECGKPRKKKTENCPVERQCDNRDEPICGSDGKTYRNTCLFVVAKCQAKEQNKKLTLKKRGKCGSKKSSKPCPKSCPSNNRPVCGTDNKTYTNGCHLAAAKCALPKKDRGSLRLQYNGPCGVPSTPKPCPRWEDCTVVDKPVCGSDGKTYPNICRLRVAMCHARRNKHRSIKLKYRDACKKRRNGKNGKKQRKGKKGKKGKKNGKDRFGRKGKRQD